MTCAVLRQDPLDKRAIVVNFEDWLGSAEIDSAAWEVPSDLTAESSSETNTTATNYFSGGTEGQEYIIACTITTNEAVPRKKTQRIKLKIRNSCS